MKKSIANQGQSLLEMVFSIGILLIAVAAILALTTANVIGQKESESQIIANNLAREGIEVVRNFRDSNWLAGRPWDSGLVADGTAVPVFTKATNSWQLDFMPNSFGDLPTRIYLDGVVYNQQGIGQLTNYQRLLKFYPICLYTSGNREGEEVIRNLINQDCQPGNQKKIGIKIESEVGWLERGKDRRVQLESLLYAWK